MSKSNIDLKGYKGLARSKLVQWGLGVWSDVRVTNDSGSVFEGVVLPRSETFDDLHIVIKMKNGYNLGVHVDRVQSIEEVGYKKAVYKIMKYYLLLYSTRFFHLNSSIHQILHMNIQELKNNEEKVQSLH